MTGNFWFFCILILKSWVGGGKIKRIPPIHHSRCANCDFYHRSQMLVLCYIFQGFTRYSRKTPAEIATEN
jgi:hypothetical protein